MAKSTQNQDHQEIDLLLPWYVNDTLDPLEHDRVSAHVATCTSCRESVSLLMDVQAAVARNKATPIIPEPRVTALLDAIAVRDTVRHRYANARIFLAAAGITALLIATLVLTNTSKAPHVPNTFETATSNLDSAAMDYVLSIRFESGSSRADQELVLQDINARDISGGSEIGAFRVIVQLPAASLEELEHYTENLEALPVVKSVDVVALQIPMRTKQ